MWQASLLHILLFKISKRKQKTLAAFGFKKKVMHRGEEINVDIPNEVDLEGHYWTLLVKSTSRLLWYIFLFLSKHNPSFTLFLICSYFFTQSELQWLYKVCSYKKKECSRVHPDTNNRKHFLTTNQCLPA